MRVLMSAYACEPNMGSEAGVGWNWAAQAALHGHEVHVITRSNNQAVIEKEQGERPIPGLVFHYYDLPSPLPRWKKRTGYYGLLTYYYFWQLGVWNLARRLHEAQRFDLAHHVTFVNDWMPSGVGWIHVPFIWGPVGGSTNVLPPSMREFIPPHARRYELVRRTTQKVLRTADPFVALTRKRADLILTFTQEALGGLPPRYRSKARAVVHVGIPSTDLPEPTKVPGMGEVFTVVSGSRLVHWRGFDLLIEAFARYLEQTGADARLMITGDGPFRPYLERQIRSLKLGENVVLMGRLPTRADVYQIVESADLFALPILRDGPSASLLEAMLAGRPVLCLDHGGSGEMVPESVGFKLKVESRNQVIEDITKALVWADSHRVDLARMGREARTYAIETHDWNRIGNSIDAVYREITLVPSAAPNRDTL
jgi:glycosyltransferase involved in cell wall biosynthesis